MGSRMTTQRIENLVKEIQPEHPIPSRSESKLSDPKKELFLQPMVPIVPYRL
jgi:hypothetical protein